MPPDESAEKTEEATPHKRQKAKEKGNVANSKDMTGFFVLCVALFSLFLFFKTMLTYIGELYIYYTEFYAQKDIGLLDIYQIAIISAQYYVMITMPLALIIMIAGVLGNVFQFGFIFSSEPIKPNIGKINPIAGLKRLFSLKVVVDTFKLVFQVSIVFTVAFILLWGFLEELPEVTLFDYFYQLIWLRDKALILVGAILGIFLLFALFDLSFTRHQHNKQLRMTKQEVKDEFKNIDGNPEIKARIRQVQMQMARDRMMSDVGKSDVVITNPTHYAVAILYDKDKIGLPIVTAKGVDFMANQIKALARENGVPIVENRPLARQLYAEVRLGGTIPDKLFKAVAEVLAYVARVNNKQF